MLSGKPAQQVHADEAGCTGNHDSLANRFINGSLQKSDPQWHPVNVGILEDNQKKDNPIVRKSLCVFLRKNSEITGVEVNGPARVKLLASGKIDSLRQHDARVARAGRDWIGDNANFSVVGKVTFERVINNQS
jgi:hypothetical protein